MALKSIRPEIYNSDRFKQEKLCCVPNCIAMIADNEFDTNYDQIDILSAMTFSPDTDLKFYVSEKDHNYFLEKYNKDFKVSRKSTKWGLSIKSLNRFLLLLNYMISVDKKLDNQLFFYEEFNSARSYIRDNFKKVLSEPINKERDYYLLAFIDYGRLDNIINRKSDRNYYHCVIVNKVMKDTVELLIPREDNNVEVRVVTIKDLLKSLSGKFAGSGFSFIRLVKRSDFKIENESDDDDEFSEDY